MSSVTRQNV